MSGVVSIAGSLAVTPNRPSSHSPAGRGRRWIEGLPPAFHGGSEHSLARPGRSRQGPGEPGAPNRDKALHRATDHARHPTSEHQPTGTLFD